MPILILELELVFFKGTGENVIGIFNYFSIGYIMGNCLTQIIRYK